MVRVFSSDTFLIAIFFAIGIFANFAIANVKAQQTENSQFFRELIEEKYRQQWFKAEDRPFSMNVAEEIYLQEDDLM